MVELEIIRRAREGDIAAFEEIYRCYSGMVYRVALRMLGNVEDAQEVVQAVFLAIHGHLRDFAGRSSIKTWIYRITINRSLNAIKVRRQRKEVPWEEGFDPPDPGDGLKPAHEHDRAREVAVMMEGLNPDQRACLLLRAQEGLSYEEIARSLGINLNTVRTRIKRAREALIEVYGKRKVLT